jgi:hypothetical protein
MSAIPIRTNLLVKNIVTQLTSTGTSFINPPIYLWSVFFKIDGTTAQIDLMGTTGWQLQGTASVIGTPGNQGDLPGGVQASFYQEETTAIPSSLGNYVTTLVPFQAPIVGSVGGMIVGWLGILLYQQDTPADAVAAGHEALNGAVLQALNNVIPTISNTNQTITQGDISSAETLIRTQVVDAIINSLSFWDKLGTVLNDTFQDTYVGLGLQYFTDSQLLGSPAQGLPIQSAVEWGGTDDPNLYTFTFNGTVFADWSPFSLRRIMTGIGHAAPVSLRAVAGPAGLASLSAWMEAVI